MQFIGIDPGSSSAKVSVLNGETGECLATSYSQEDEMIINTSLPGWAEQDPQEWYNNLKIALSESRRAHWLRRARKLGSPLIAAGLASK